MKKLLKAFAIACVAVMMAAPGAAAPLEFINEPEALRISKEAQAIMKAARQSGLDASLTYIHGSASSLRFPINTVYRMASALGFIQGKAGTGEAMAAALTVANVTIEQNMKHLREMLDDVRGVTGHLTESNKENLFLRLEKCIQDSIALLEDMKKRCQKAFSKTGHPPVGG